MKFLQLIDRWITRGISIFATIAMLLLTGIVFIQVVCRYVLGVAVGPIEELPVYMMIIAIWTTATINVRNRDHISLDIIKLFVHNKKITATCDFIVEVMTTVVLILFLRLFWKYFAYAFKAGSATAGLGIPMYMLLGVLLVCIVMMIVYNIVNTIKLVRK